MNRLLDTFERRTRAVRRLAQSVVDPRLYPTSVPVRAYWWTGNPNFGDDLTRVLMPSWGIAPVLKPARKADFFGVGSVIELIPEGFGGWVWGSGKMHEDVSTRLPHARVLAVRGALTRDLMRLRSDTVLGDPGLLASRVVSRPARLSGRIAIVPHFTHQGLPDIRSLRDRLGDEAIVIDVTRPARRVIREIARADAVVTTSLHGLIIADSYGIPAAWSLPEPVLSGGSFKFRDHESVVSPDGANRRISLSDMRDAATVRMAARHADPVAVSGAQDALIGSLDAVKGPRARRVSPVFLAREQWRE